MSQRFALIFGMCMAIAGLVPGPAVAQAVIASPAGGSTLAGASQLFQWNSGGATGYQLWLGSAPGASDIGVYPSGGGLTGATSLTATRLPTNGQTVYARLYSVIGGAYQSSDSAYTATTGPAVMASPADGATLGGSTQRFLWNDAGASSYQIWIGTTPGGQDVGVFPPGGTATRSVDVSGLPTDGRTLHVRLWSQIGGSSYSTDSTYVAANIAPPASIFSPANGATLAGSSQLFQWNDAGASGYQLWVGSSPGSSDIGYFPTSGFLTPATSITATGLPTDGRTLYVRLYSAIGGVFYATDFSYTSGAGPATITSPSSGSTLTSAQQTFAWNQAGAALYQLWVGTAVGAHDLGVFPQAGTTATSIQASGLPTDGRALYVRLWSNFGGTWVSTDATYTAASIAPPASIFSPANGATLSGATQLFQWNDSGALYYQLWVGTSPGALDVGVYPNGVTAATSITATGLPTDGAMLYVRLWSNIGGVWYSRDFSYTAAVGPAAITTPVPGTTLTGADETFRWSDAHATNYQVWIGTTVGGYELGFYPPGGTAHRQAQITGLPIDGRTLYVRLWSQLEGVYHYTDAVYEAASIFPAEITSPANLGAVPGPSQAFQWTAGNASMYQLWIGTSSGTHDIGVYPNGGVTTATSVMASGLPTDGTTLYVTLWSAIGGKWYSREFVYNP